MLNIFILLRGKSICFIPNGIIIRGAMDLKVPSYVYGTIDGDLISSKRIFIGRSGVINGSINAKEVIINGIVEGNILALGKAEIKKNGIVKGRVNAAPVLLEKGGIIKGKVNASEEEIQKENEAEQNKITILIKEQESKELPASWF